MIFDDGEFEEEKHPRDKNGQFASAGSEGPSGPVDDKRVNKLINAYASMEASTSPVALQFRGAVGKAFNVDATQDAKRLAGMHHALYRRGLHINEPQASPRYSREVVAKNLEKGAAEVDTVREMAKRSQAVYTGDHVTLYRGITGPQAKQIMEAVKSGKPVEIKVDTLSSFTDSPSMAKQFAGHGALGRKKQDGVVIKVQVPVHAIVATHKVFPKLAKESEVMVASHGGFSVDPSDIEFAPAAQ